jgi:hypothetical protein
MVQERLKNQTESTMAWDDLRTSPAFPAIVGGLAGAIGGLTLMFLFSRLSKPKQKLPAAYDADGNPMNVVYLPAPPQFRILGYTFGDLVTLATAGFSLYRQIQTMARENERKAAAPLPASSMLPPAPTEMMKTSSKQ